MIERKNTFIEKLHECHQHKMRLLKAKQHLAQWMPLTEARYAQLDDIEMSFIDQMVFRFSKFQDAMGEKCFPALLSLMGEEIKSKPFIDRLNRIEELGILDKNEWLELRKNRNEVAPEYRFNQDEVVAGLNLIFESTERLIAIYDQFYRYCQDRFDWIVTQEG